MKVMTGKVVSNKMNKTIVVEVIRKTVDPLYRKIIFKKNKLKVHNENKKIEVGDIVKFTQTKPLSKDKHYKLI